MLDTHLQLLIKHCLRSETLSWGWRSRLPRLSESRSLRLRNRQRSNLSWRRPRLARSTIIISSTSNVETSTFASKTEPSRPPTYISVQTTSTCSLTTSTRLTTHTSCQRTCWRSSSSSQISGPRSVYTWIVYSLHTDSIPTLRTWMLGENAIYIIFPKTKMQNIDLWFNDKGTVKSCHLIFLKCKSFTVLLDYRYNINVYTIFCSARLLVTCTEWAPWQPPGEEDPMYRVTPAVGDPPDGPHTPLPAQPRVSEGTITLLGTVWCPHCGVVCDEFEDNYFLCLTFTIR